ncbi:hypothetical protein A6M27_10695 [Acidithiobacillus thiooxidans]|uniref:Uncharacterized protein n=1 Tax=Acidithiobacillus thiooxidans TaxID=930 RepID=A0A1C2HVC4_ACITH|nr:hypothetical protein A6P07_19605 [Acidithiobacillus thiooxidans]OCX68150.1 hypothetical protein A6O24_20000 [Acidithiobacillus thiooxidans]OCX80027.1 hypothetical protein A6O26_15935 [Acidithiobacillus thiooxidans]OCX87178.1 hypothetical protein A6M27_10695 [Acidithiobacillus thiooxidans]OFC40676.1 hypothetical protein BAE47_19800 [Acidithiobacillus thiooxidans]
MGILRLDQSFLVDQGLQWGKAQALRWYVDPATGDKWLVKIKKLKAVGCRRLLPPIQRGNGS